MTEQALHTYKSEDFNGDIEAARRCRDDTAETARRNGQEYWLTDEPIHIFNRVSRQLEAQCWFHLTLKQTWGG